MATAGLYRRVLPSPPAIEFASPEGKQLFAEAYQDGKMEVFFKLISYFQTQSEPAYCGLASLAMVLNALGIDPGRKWKGPWRWFDESMLDCCEPLEKIKDEGITFTKVACLALCNGANVQAFRTNQSTIDVFRQYVITCTSSDDCHLITSYSRRLLKQTGSGHFSPIGGYHAGRDMVLILDVARFKYPPHWVPLALLWEAMNTIDEVTKLRRGFMLITRPDKAPSLLYTLSCKVDSWVSIAKYLVEDVSIILKSEDVKDVQTVLSLVFTSQPMNFGEFIKWVIEVRKEEDGGSILSKEEKGRVAMKEEVLKEVKETELFKHVTEWLSAATSCCPSFTNGHSAVPVVSGTAVKNRSEHMIDMLIPKSKTSCCGSSPVNCVGKHPGSSDILTALLLALPPHTWSGIKDDKLLQEIHGLVSTDSLPPLLQEEVLHLRRQLLVLTECLDDNLEVPSLT